MTTSNTLQSMEIRKALSKVARIGSVTINSKYAVVEITRPVVVLSIREDIDSLLDALGWSVVSWQQYQTTVTVKAERISK